MNKLVAVVIVYILLTLAMATGGDKTGVANINGKWTAIGQIVDGKKIPGDLIEKEMNVLVFKDGKYTEMVMGKNIESGTYKIDAARTPATIDFTILEGTAKGKTQLGLIKLDGDVLTLALAQHGSTDRPKNFEGTDGTFVTTLKRDK
jgi:uncharacterized protein (TIGR03067 family)